MEEITQDSNRQSGWRVRTESTSISSRESELLKEPDWANNLTSCVKLFTVCGLIFGHENA